MHIPEDLLYTKDHKWVKKDADDKATVGITNYLQLKTGKIQNVDIEGKQSYEQGQKFGLIEGEDLTDDLNVPVTSYIDTVNSEIEDYPNLINNDPYGEGWLVKLTDCNPDQFDDLMDAAQYEQYLSGLNIPGDLLYTEDHIWVRKESDNKITVGVTAFGQVKCGEVNDFQFLESDFCEKGQKFGIIEGQLLEFDTNTPVSGYIDTVNTEIEDRPILINDEPYGEGWLLVLKEYDHSQLSELMDADAYKKFIERVKVI